MPTVEQARDWYDPGDPVHGFDHVLRVYQTAEWIGQSEGADLEIVRAAVLLHDAQGSDTLGGEQGRADHHLASAEFAAEALAAEGWPPERIEAAMHCIRAHRFRGTEERPSSLEARVVFDADKLDVLGAVGVVRTIAYAVMNGQPAYAPPSARFLESGQQEPGEPHSAYHEYLFKLQKIKGLLHTATAQQMARERHQFMAAFFERLGAEMHGEA